MFLSVRAHCGPLLAHRLDNWRYPVTKQHPFYATTSSTYGQQRPTIHVCEFVRCVTLLRALPRECHAFLAGDAQELLLDLAQVLGGMRGCQIIVIPAYSC